MKIRHTSSRSATHTRRFSGFQVKALSVVSLASSLSLAAVGRALAQTATSPTGGLGAQMNLISSEAINSGSTGFGMACYLAATVCFGLGVWALWQSRQPQNRESGNIGKGIAGLVLCGLFATAGVWINKASVTASGGSASVNDTPSMVQFGSGNAGG